MFIHAGRVVYVLDNKMEAKFIHKKKDQDQKTSRNGDSSNSHTYTRFTKKEKEILFTLFRQYEEIIDAKHRKNVNHHGKAQKGQLIINTPAVRECWNKIAMLYNSNLQITTRRNVKQLQKFWLNARLRKLFPPASPKQECYDNSTIVKSEIIDASIEESNQCNIPNNEKIFIVSEQQGIEPQQEESRIITRSLEESQEIHAQEDQECITPNEENEITHHHHHHQQQHENSEQELGDCIEQISTEKLSLNDLLHFKTVNPMNTMTINQPVVVTNCKQTQAIPIQINRVPHQTSEIPSTSNMNITSSTFIPSRTITIQQPDSLEDKINYYKIKELEFKYEEEQIRLEKSRIELEKCKEELRYMKEIHSLQIEEMKIKIKLMDEKNKITVINS